MHDEQGLMQECMHAQHDSCDPLKTNLMHIRTGTPPDTGARQAVVGSHFLEKAEM